MLRTEVLCGHTRTMLCGLCSIRRVGDLSSVQRAGFMEPPKCCLYQLQTDLLWARNLNGNFKDSRLVYLELFFF